MKGFFQTLLLVALNSNGTNAQTATVLASQDTRNVATTPADYNHNLLFHFKNYSAMGLPNTGTGYSSVLGLRSWGDNSGGKAYEMAFSDDGQMRIRSGYSPSWEAWRRIIAEEANGNVGIGTTNPGAYKLAVEGTIGARKLIVTQSAWADYVFHPTYKLPSLQEVEAYIKSHQHLPDVPSTADVEKNGIDVGENQATLLKKIEELTLYLIELKKQLDEQQLTINAQSKIVGEQQQLLLEFRKSKGTELKCSKRKKLKPFTN